MVDERQITEPMRCPMRLSQIKKSRPEMSRDATVFVATFAVHADNPKRRQAAALPNQDKSRQDFPDDTTVHVGEPEVSTLKAKRQALMVESEQM